MDLDINQLYRCCVCNRWQELPSIARACERNHKENS